MRGRRVSLHLGRGARAALSLIVATLFAASPALVPAAPSVLAAVPKSDTISPTGPTVTWTGDATGGSSPLGADTCTEGINCDTFKLTVGGVKADWAGKLIRVKIEWLSPSNDYDLSIRKGSPTGTEVGSSGNGPPSTSEQAVIDPNVNDVGDYYVRAIYFAVTPLADQYHGSATVETKPLTPPSTPPAGAAPRYQNYQAPAGVAEDAGEPSIGADWETGAAMFQSYTTTYKVTFNDCTSPAGAKWENKSDPLAIISLDPILFCDHYNDPATGPRRADRTYTSQLGPKCSIGAYTDNDGETYMRSQGCGVNAGVDHQTVGAGPYSTRPGAVTPPHPLYPNAWYYCSQDIAVAQCARSDDGGTTFGPAIPMYTAAQCGGLHGHVKVSPFDGVVYVPNKNCNGKQAVVVSEDNGVTWSVRPIPDSVNGDTDPSVGIATDGTVYFGYDDGSGVPKITKSTNRGLNWTASKNVGPGLVSTVFPAVAAGDPNRASFAFHGTTTNDANQIWHLYIATTYDGGATWFTVDATPNDPVQRGNICTGGTTCGSDRNLLDFFDATIDRQGRLLVGWADGCIDACVEKGPNSFSAKGTITRQSGGRRLFSAYDPVEPAPPGAPLVTATRDSSGIHLRWSPPDNGGSAITSYEVYRSTTETGTYTKIATTSLTKYDDTTAVSGTVYYYRVRARNAVGLSPLGVGCPPLKVGAATTVDENPCTPPGMTVLTDPAGDQFTAPAGEGYDFQHAWVSEPYFGPTATNPDKLVFTMKLGGAPEPATTYPLHFRGTDGKGYFVRMKTNATGAPSYNYGTSVYQMATNNYGADTPLGPADSGSTSPDGTVKIVVGREKFVTGTGATQTKGAPIGGQLDKWMIRVRTDTPGLGITPDNAPDSLAAGGNTYTVKGNQACKPNTPPVAFLTATPTKGEAPLTVKFDARGSSDPDAGDTVVSYTFNFGDGSPSVTRTTPSASHIYREPGEYQATLTVKDNHGLQSSNTARVRIEVEGEASLSVADTSITEGDTDKTMLFRVTLSRASSETVTVRYQTADGTAKAPADYTAKTGTLTFSPGQTSQNVGITVKGENLRENTERMYLYLSDATNAAIADRQATGTIYDDDPDDPIVNLTKSGPLTAAPGAQFSYTITYQNVGPLPSSNGKLVDTLPAGLSLSAIPSGSTYNATARTITWNLGTVNVDGLHSLTVTVRVLSSTPVNTIITNRIDYTGDLTWSAPAVASTTVR